MGENAIDEFLRERGNDIELAPPELQYYGVDRICVNEVGGLPYYLSLEYKTDYRAFTSGNLFIETQIRERNGLLSPGWLRKSVAQLIVFYLPQMRRLIFVDTNELREYIFCYGMKFRQSDWIENKGGYAGKGILLPIVSGQVELRTWIEMSMEYGTGREVVEALFPTWLRQRSGGRERPESIKGISAPTR